MSRQDSGGGEAVIPMLVVGAVLFGLFAINEGLGAVAFIVLLLAFINSVP